MKPLVYALPGSESFAQGIAARWPADAGLLQVRRFPDGESLVRLATDPRGRDVLLICSLHEPDAKVLPLLFAAGTARELGARSVGLVAPYLAYMRQDRRFHPGEAVSAPHFARLLSQHFDWLVTVDPHLHRVESLDRIYTIPTAIVPAASHLARWIGAHVDRPVLIGPDDESRQWVARIAAHSSAPHLVLEKVRLDDRRVDVRVPDLSSWLNHTPVLVDDIVSTGGTLANVIAQLREQGLKAPVCVAVHAVFAEWAYWALLEAGAGRIVTTNTIEHDSNAIDLCAAVTEVCRARVGAFAPPDAARLAS